MLLLAILIAIVNSQPYQLQEGVVLSTECKLYDSAERLISALRQTCPTEYDSLCADPIFDPYNVFHFRCQLKYETGLLNVDIEQFTKLLSLDHMNHSWCMVTFLYSNNCPFSYQFAPEFNKLPNYYRNLYFVGMNAAELRNTKLNVRAGIVGTPTVALWVNGVIAARLYHKKMNLEELHKFIGMHTDQEPRYSANRGEIGSSIVVIMGEYNLNDKIYDYLCFLAVFMGLAYYFRERLLGRLEVFQWIREKFGVEQCEIFYHLLYVVPPRLDHEFVINNDAEEEAAVEEEEQEPLPEIDVNDEQL